MGCIQCGFSGVGGGEPCAATALTFDSPNGPALAGKSKRFFDQCSCGGSEGWGLDGEAVSNEYACCARRNQ